MSDVDDDGIIPDEENSDLDIDVPECDSDSEVSLLDFSSGSDDNYSPHISELETSDHEDNHGHQEPQPGPSGRPTLSTPALDPWVRVYPPEEPKDVSSHFLVRETGLKDPPPRNSAPITYLNLFLSPNFWLLLTRETNAYATRFLDGKNLTPNSRYRSWKNVAVSELKSWFGILLNMGLTVRKNIKSYWDSRPDQNIPFYSKTMSLNRFLIISTFIHLTSARTLPRNDPNYDPWVKIRWILDHANTMFKKYFIPSQNVCIDESLIGMKHRCAFIQYLPNKKHKQYGIKKFQSCDSKSNYVIHIEIYSGTDYLAVTDKNAPLFTQRVVMEVMEKSRLLDKGYHLFTDNFYSKIPLAEELLARKTFMTGTINKKSKHLSTTVKRAQLGARESLYFRKGEILLVGFRQKISRKPVLVITTGYHAEDKIVTSKKGLVGRKPLLIHNYNQSMGGVDVSDKSIYHMSCNRQTSKYWKKIFFNIIDTCMFNAYVLYTLNSDRPIDGREFHRQVVLSLVSQERPDVQPTAGPAGDGGAHNIEHLPGNSARKCVVCNKGTNQGRTRFWCPGCNCGVHRECFYKLQHYWRPLRGEKRQLGQDPE